MTRTVDRQRQAASELLDFVEFAPDGRLTYVDSHVTGDDRRLLLALLLLLSCDQQDAVEDALEALEELVDAGLERDSRERLKRQDKDR